MHEVSEKNGETERLVLHRCALRRLFSVRSHEPVFAGHGHDVRGTLKNGGSLQTLQAAALANPQSRFRFQAKQQQKFCNARPESEYLSGQHVATT
ncbi:MAG: hypothetical protein V4772_08065 [Pseudomonadota bacterium]